MGNISLECQFVLAGKKKSVESSNRSKQCHHIHPLLIIQLSTYLGTVHPHSAPSLICECLSFDWFIFIHIPCEVIQRSCWSNMHVHKKKYLRNILNLQKPSLAQISLCWHTTKSVLLKKQKNVYLKNYKKNIYWNRSAAHLTSHFPHKRPARRKNYKQNFFYYIQNIFITFQIFSIHSKYFCYIPNILVTFQIFYYIPNISHYIPNYNEKLRFDLFWLKCALTEQRRNNCVPAQDLDWLFVKKYLRYLDAVYINKP